MNRYVYFFRCEQRKDETLFRFAKFPEIISSIPTTRFRTLAWRLSQNTPLMPY